jgi:hypothetical protein
MHSKIRLFQNVRRKLDKHFRFVKQIARNCFNVYTNKVKKIDHLIRYNFLSLAYFNDTI